MITYIALELYCRNKLHKEEAYGMAINNSIPGIISMLIESMCPKLQAVTEVYSKAQDFQTGKKV